MEDAFREAKCFGPSRSPLRLSRLNFVAYWRQENSNPALRPFLGMLRERYPDLSANPRPD